MRVFFTVGTLFRFGCGFGFGDAFLELFFENFLEEFLSFGAEEVIEVVEGVSVLGGVHDVLAFGEQGIEFFVEEGVEVGGGAVRGGHTILPCKKGTVPTFYKTPTKFLHTLSRMSTTPLSVTFIKSSSGSKTL